MAPTHFFIIFFWSKMKYHSVMIAFDQSNNNRELVISIMKLNEVFFYLFYCGMLKMFGWFFHYWWSHELQIFRFIFYRFQLCQRFILTLQVIFIENGRIEKLFLAISLFSKNIPANWQPNIRRIFSALLDTQFLAALFNERLITSLILPRARK